MSSTSTLFSLVLLAFVKHVAGMRGFPEAASMIETEASLWGKDGCAKFGAKKKSRGTCQCPKDRPLPRNCYGRSGRDFHRKKSSEEGSDCRCEEDPSLEKVTAWRDPCEKFGAKKKSRGTCQCPKDRSLPRNCYGRSGRSFHRKKSSEEGSDCRCEEDPSLEKVTAWRDPCEKFGAKKKSKATCQCPTDRPIPGRNCEGRFGTSFNRKKTIKAGSNCRCEESPSCEKFGAKSYESIGADWCHCPKYRPRATKECGRINGDIFRRSEASAGCQCLTEVEAMERLAKMPVAASALRFCEALAAQGYEHHITSILGGDMSYEMHRALNKTSPQICQHALTGTINKTEAEEAPWAEEASELSRKGSDEDGNPDRGYGRMRAVKENATTSPTEKALWEHALAQVCKDECEDLLHTMKKETEHLQDDVYKNHVPFAQACAERVVQHVEAEVLGCCGRSCGFDGRRCLLWPFFSPQEKVDWEVECCAEISILKNSSRELMCNSVLPDRLAKKASNFDLEEQSGTDIGKVLIGQNTSLFWTQTGAQESALGKKAKAHGGEKVNMDFLIKHKKVGEEYLRLGYFKEEPISKMLNEATSMMEVSSQDDTCNFGHFGEQCPKKFMTTFVKKCNEAWNVAKGFRHFLTHPAIGNCDESDPQNFSTPEECERLEVNSFGTVFLHYFEYNKDNKDLPIKCFSVSVSNETKKQCKGKDDWWKRIKEKFMSVQKLMNDNKRDVNDYAQLVYIKSMKTN